MRLVIFDLDGTITDPADGITRSINYALAELGQPPRSAETLLQYIGPPLTTTFSALLGQGNEEAVSRAIMSYRQRYTTVGYRENRLYDGITDALSKLCSEGATLSIATSKREDIARQVLRFLGVEAFFSTVRGCDLDRTKTELLRDILSDAAPADSSVMVGDRDSDFVAAREVGVPSIGVKWGYGSDKELMLATAIVERPADLPTAVVEYAQHCVTRCGAQPSRR